MRRLLQTAKDDPIRACTLVVAAVASLYVLVYPFLLVRYPPLTDLPFHAAQVAIFLHHSDPAWHFAEQFSLHPFEVPYLSMYLIGMAAGSVLPITTAAKVMTIAMLALLPLGLAVLLAGMRRSPLWGLSGLGLVWTDLTHWGFSSFVGAAGLYAMSLGCALLVLRAPTRKRQIALGAVLVVLFFTHPFRFPFALGAIALAGLVTLRAAGRWRSLLAPCGASLAPFVAWLLVKPAALAPASVELGFDLGRWRRAGERLFDNYLGATAAAEHRIGWSMLGALAAVVVLTLVYRDPAASPDPERSWRRAMTVLVLLVGSGHLLAYFVLPGRIGEWWYVYPRELHAAALFGLAAVPALPRQRWLQLGVVSLVALATGRMAAVTAKSFAAFELATADFREAVATLPRAPKLAYLVISHLGTDKRHSPFVHLPAWVQAEKGGWLSFHFAGWGIFPVRYRSGSPSVPPAVERDWEWSPERFRVLEHGRFFDWFLLRSEDDPSSAVAVDPSVELVERHGTWWVYRRH